LPERKRLIVVSNRLPYVLEKQNGDKWVLKPGSGGLVTALLPVLRDRGGVWIGWSGTTQEIAGLDDILGQAAREAGYELKAIALTEEEVDKYYHGYSNESLWPLFHDLQSRCDFVSEYWHAYVRVNRKFAEALARDCTPDDFVWIHDYQLMDVAHHLRDHSPCPDLAFFLHIPFPQLDIFMKLPERQALLNSLLAYDLIGFQTVRDRRNFLQCVRALIKNARVRADGHLHVIRLEDRELRVGNFPIGIDAASFAIKAASPDVAERAEAIRTRFHGRQIVLGLDRLDYTKGIPQRLKAFADLLERFPEVRRRIHLFQVVVPSRVGIPKY
jgi:trehalose 6-phosphate synthase/phosphatase